MSRAVWHKYPEDKPKENGLYLVTVAYGKKLRVYLDYYMTKSIFLLENNTFSWYEPTAWTEPMCLEWHDYTKDKPKKDGLYILKDKGSKRLSYGYYSTESEEFNLDMPFPMVEWAETPEPYKGE